MSTKPQIGFIGLGIMGAPMAGHLLKAGYPLKVYNRTRSKTQLLVDEGASLTESPADAARGSEFVITIVSDTPDVDEVIRGSGGVLEGVQEGCVVVDMSTVSPALERELDSLLREKGSTLVDAPVSGGDVGARNATLSIMAGGDPAAFEKVRPLFEVMGKGITYCGPVGSGQLTKLCNQILVSINLLGVCEALNFAERNGLDANTVIEAIKGGAAGSWQLTNLGPRMVAGDFEPGFMIDLMLKDLRLVLEAADRSSTSVATTAVVHRLFDAAQAAGDGRAGTQALFRMVAGKTES